MSVISTYFNLSIQALQRNNPVYEVMARIQAIVDSVMNYESNKKLNRYRNSLYMQQLRRMEGFLNEGSPYAVRGDKMDRRF